MTRKFYILLLLSIICTFLGASAFAQKAGSGSDQIATFAAPIDGVPTEGNLWGMPVNLHGQSTYINQRYPGQTSKLLTTTTFSSKILIKDVYKTGYRQTKYAYGEQHQCVYIIAVKRHF